MRLEAHNSIRPIIKFATILNQNNSMKHILLTTLTVAFAWLGFAQSLQEANVNINYEPTQYHPSNNYRTTSCGPDTVGYALAKASSVQALNINNASSAQAVTQYFDCPQDITINGADFFAYKFNASGGTTLNATVEVYLAGPDSMPTGAALASTTVLIDTSLAPGTLDALRKTATFSSSVTVNQPYCIVIGNYSANGMGLIFNSWTAEDGGQEWLCSVDLFGTWTRGYGLNLGGFPFDADLLVEPHIEYDLTAAFTQTETCVSDSGSTATLTNTSSPILWNRMYSQAAFIGSNGMQSTWNFGDGSPSGTAVDTSHTYNTTGPWTVSLTDTLFGWRTTCVDMTTMGTASNPACCADTLLFEDFQSQMIPATWGNFDNDGNTPNNAIPSDWYTMMDAQNTTPGDTNYVAAATSWFNPLGTADNLLVLDPVTVCDPTMSLIWKSAPVEGPGFADGYAVMIDVLGDTVGAFEVARLAEDIGGGAGTWGPGWQHTNFNGNNGVLQEWSLPLAAYNGQTIEISFHHDSDDDNLIFLDDIFVGVCNTTEANFSDSISGSTVVFTDMSTLNPSSWLWDFGDGNTSTQQNPVHTYATGGTYTVCLTATNACGTDSSCASVSMCMEAAPAITGFSNVSHRGTTISWNSPTLQAGGQFVVRYHEFGNSPNFSYKVVSNTTASSAYINDLEPDTRYVFRVGAKCSTQIQASFSDTSSVWTKKYCTPPSGFFAALDTINFDDVWCTWSNVGADSYKVKLRPVGGTWEYRNTTSNFAQYDIELGTQYEWKVRSICNDGGNRPYGPTQQFITPPARLAAPTTEGFTVYPNPSNGEVTLEMNTSEAPAQLILSDVSGRIVYTESIVLGPNYRGSFHFNVETGSYLLQVISNENVENVKLEIR